MSALNDTRQSANRPTGGPELLVLIPLYNDWDAVSLLLMRLDQVLAEASLRPDVLLVDDGSTTQPDAIIGASGYVAIRRIEVLTLRLNMGHQRAIALALAYVEDSVGPGAVVIMDGDGEDAPEDVPRLVARLQAANNCRIIFAERTRRSESLSFRAFYGLYRLAHLLLTGIPVRVGNFSIVPAGHLRRLVVIPELWNHYAAAVFKTRLPRDTIPTVRAERLSGHGRMNLMALIGHGLSALSVHSEVIGVRLLAATTIAIIAVTILLATVFVVRTTTPLAIPGWATTAAGLLLVLLVQAIAFAFFFVFLVLHGRSQPLFIAIRDYRYFVGGTSRLFPQGSAENIGRSAACEVPNV